MNERDWKMVENCSFIMGMLQLTVAVVSWFLLQEAGICIWSIAVLAFSLYLSTYAHVKRVTEREMDEEMLEEGKKSDEAT